MDEIHQYFNHFGEIKSLVASYIDNKRFILIVIRKSESAQALFVATANEINGKSVHEDVFWRNIAQRTNVPLYSIDNELSLFPRSGTNENCWNLAKFTKQESLIHQVCVYCTV